MTKENLIKHYQEKIITAENYIQMFKIQANKTPSIYDRFDIKDIKAAISMTNLLIKLYNNFTQQLKSLEI
ncbi:MAG: hypothetical protein OEL54_01690 [Flavobacteriaceae bacterium]|nr:hypothetical protein [Flavobacteriaceae bacterium]